MNKGDMTMLPERNYNVRAAVLAAVLAILLCVNGMIGVSPIWLVIGGVILFGAVIIECIRQWVALPQSHPSPEQVKAKRQRFERFMESVRLAQSADSLQPSPGARNDLSLRSLAPERKQRTSTHVNPTT